MRETAIGIYRLRLLGGFTLDTDSGGAAPPLPKRRAEAVLALLAVCGHRGCSRERLLALLWPESDEGGARQGLRDALYAIRRTLGQGAVPSGGRILRLDPVVVATDVGAFAEALADGRPVEAVRLYAGPLLDGFHVDDAAEFEQWLDGERARLAREYGEALKQLAAEAEAAGAWDEALGWWSRAVAHDPVSSWLVLQQVRVLATMGDRANAIRVAEGHARRLRDEFDLEPDPEILATVERIRRGELPAQQGSASAAPAAVAARPSPAEAAPRIESSPAAPAAVRRGPRWLPWAAGIAATVTIAGIGAGRLPGTRAEAGAAPTSIAVLPFRNLSEDSSHAFFAEGLHDELLTQLAKVGSLRVIGRTSVHEYEGTPKPLSEIGQELAVGSVVEAGVQVVGDRLRVTVRLLDPATGAHRWAERYDRTLNDAFVVQSEIAQRIVTEVGATLTSAEGGAIAAPPTRDPSAYEFYLQGLAYHRRPGFLLDNYRVAQQLYERALGLDSGFALAHAALASLHVAMYKLGHDHSPERLALARREADAALRLGPGLPQAHLAAALMHEVDGRYRDALDQLTLGLRGAPSDPEMWFWIAISHRGLGNWDSTVAALEHARRLDPRDANLGQFLGDTYHFLRRYPEAIEAYRQASAFAPDLVQSRLSLAWSYFLWRGELDTLRAVFDGLPVDGSAGMGGQTYGDQRLILMLWERRPDSLLSLLRAMEGGPYGGDDGCCYRAILAADAHRLRGDTAAARATLDYVVALLDGEGVPDELGSHTVRGMALATLGRRAEAMREVRWLERNEPLDRYNKWFRYFRARILARLGDADAAFALIEQLLAEPSLFSVHELRISPDFDPLRSDPRYRELLLKYGEPPAASIRPGEVGASGSGATAAPGRSPANCAGLLACAS